MVRLSIEASKVQADPRSKIYPLNFETRVSPFCVENRNDNLMR